ncbi:MAG: (Fe-S)-binding protein [Ketobacter sp.]|uniref:(Fe-S)-binding protein n=1 Tax=Ketobacter sp. MCCC 1A13808 TaxID=2602738 RepID=UPI0018DE8150|nr:(Fe-S)-binding protein [Ketobacter sp. MCCC 1A13808]
MANTPAPDNKVALYVTCLINALRPQAAHASLKLLGSLGLEVDVPLQQTCCGQPAYNGGHQEQARSVARHQIQVLEPYSRVVVPSGSCAGMLRNHYPSLFKTGDPWHQRAVDVAGKTHELSEFLLQEGWQPSATADPLAWAHHTSCSCRRETNSHLAAEQLLLQKGIPSSDFPEQEVCCGFGGAFSTKFDEISVRMGNNKLDQIESVHRFKVVSADFGCLMHLQGLADRQGRDLEFSHLAEVLVME